MNKKYLYLPLEIVLREHDGKCTLAHEMALDDWIVLIAPKLELYRVLKQLPKGTFILKSAHPGEHKQIRYIKSLGHVILTLDEEGLVFHREINNFLRYSDENLFKVDGILFWGQDQKKHFTDFFATSAKKCFVTGSPRYEFWSKLAKETYSKKVKEILKKFNNYILIPTSFGIPNSFLKGHGMQTYIDDMRGIVSKNTLNFLFGKTESDLITFKEYLEFIPILANQFPKLNFIIRPHPSENMEVYRDIEKEVKNIYVVYSDSVTPWILASKAVIHYRSTTSIEADCLGIPTIGYVPPHPEYLSKYEVDIIKRSSIVQSERSKVKETIDKVMKGNFKNLKSNLKNSKYIKYRSKKSPSQLIKELLNKNSITVTQGILLKSNHKVNFREKLEEFLIVLNKNRIFRKFAPYRFSRNPQKLDYGNRKYIGWSFEHTKNVIQSANKIKKLSKDFVYVNKVNEKIFLIKKD